MWKVITYNDSGIEDEKVIPDSLAKSIFSNNNFRCLKNYPDFKIFFNNKRTLVFELVSEDKEDMKNE